MCAARRSVEHGERGTATLVFLHHYRLYPLFTFQISTFTFHIRQVSVCSLFVLCFVFLVLGFHIPHRSSVGVLLFTFCFSLFAFRFVFSLFSFQFSHSTFHIRLRVSFSVLCFHFSLFVLCFAFSVFGFCFSLFTFHILTSVKCRCFTFHFSLFVLCFDFLVFRFVFLVFGFQISHSTFTHRSSVRVSCVLCFQISQSHYSVSRDQ